MVIGNLEAFGEAYPAKERLVGIGLDPFAILMTKDILRINMELFLKIFDLSKQLRYLLRKRKFSSVL